MPTDSITAMRDLYDDLLALGDDAAAEGVADLVLAVEAGEVTQAEALKVLDTLL